eukprot:355745-Chlamydomonas_euryale.AAC.2
MGGLGKGRVVRGRAWRSAGKRQSMRCVCTRTGGRVTAYVTSADGCPGGGLVNRECAPNDKRGTHTSQADNMSAFGAPRIRDILGCYSLAGGPAWPIGQRPQASAVARLVTHRYHTLPSPKPLPAHPAQAPTTHLAKLSHRARNRVHQRAGQPYPAGGRAPSMPTIQRQELACATQSACVVPWSRRLTICSSTVEVSRTTAAVVNTYNLCPSNVGVIPWR